MKVKENMKNIASKIGAGICYGIGICLVIFTIGYVYDIFDSDEEKYEYAVDIDREKLVIKEHKIIIDDESRVEIIGSVQNNSNFDWHRISLEIEFYDENGNFVYECNDKIKNKILPSQKEYFKIECNSCDKSIPVFSEYKIKIIDANGRRLKK
jgi:hypothetical protein